MPRPPASRSYPSIAPPPSSRALPTNVRRRPKDEPPPTEAPSAPSQRPPSEPPRSFARSEAPPPRAPRGESKILRIGRAILGGALVIAIGSGVVWGARKYVRTSPRFVVGEIVTAGGKQRGPEEIASIAGISKGQNVFSIDLDRARARLTADPWIERAELTRQLPSTITIHVTERQAGGIVALTGLPDSVAASTPTSEGTYLVTREGAIIKRVEPGDPLDLHVVTGVPLKALVEDREGATRTIRQALDLASDYDRSPLAQRSPIEEVHVESSGDLTLIIGKSGVILRMGTAPYRKKLDQAVRIVAELDRRGAKPEIIMLDDEARPDRIVVRMK